MQTYNPDNERIKRQYFVWLKDAKRQGGAAVDAAAKALARFEKYTRYRDFKRFNFEEARAFKRHLAEQQNQTTGEKLSKATLHSTLAHLKRFFQWLADRPGYKSRFQYLDAEYFNISDGDRRIATARREQKAPTLEQVKRVIAVMPTGSEIERRNRALVAFTLLTGARVTAIASMKLKHVNLAEGLVDQDARQVRTKFSKTFLTYFFPVGDEVRQLVSDWVTYLREVKLWGNDDPLFPATQTTLNSAQQYEADGLKREHWRSSAPIRAVFREAFRAAGLPYFNPHSFRNTLVQLGENLCKTPAVFKAWSQNLGHERVLTTFLNYGEIANRHQAEIIRGLASAGPEAAENPSEVAKALLRELRALAHESSSGEPRT